MGPFLDVLQIIISIALVILILLQTNRGGLGSLFGGSDVGVYKTRRGVEKTLFNLTIVLAVIFFVVAILNVIVTG